MADGRGHVAVVLTTSGLLSAFVTLLVTIGPVETGAVFHGLDVRHSSA